MRRTAWAALLIVVSPALATAQDRPRPPADRPRMEAQQERRAQLEQQVRQQFVARAVEVLGLDGAQTDRLTAVMRSGAAGRHELARESRELRMQLVRAVRGETATPATYEQLLSRMAELRQREHQLERAEEAAMAAFLSPRQRAQLLVLRIQLNDRIRGMRGGPQGERRRDRSGDSGP